MDEFFQTGDSLKATLNLQCRDSGSVRKKKYPNRQYNNAYIKFGFTCVYESTNRPRPQCVLCYQILANESLRPSKLKRHLETRHPDCVAKPKEFFLCKLENLCQQEATTLNENETTEETRLNATIVSKEEPKLQPEEKIPTDCLMASYAVALRIAKAKEDYAVAETLLVPAMVDMCEIMLGDSAARKIETIPLSSESMSRKIVDLSEDVKMQLIDRIRQSPYFALQLDEVADVSNVVQLMCYVRIISDNEILEDILFSEEITKCTTGEEIFGILNRFFENEHIDWSKCVGVCTDGASATTAKHTSLVKCVQELNLDVKWTNCIIHWEALISMNADPMMHEVLATSIKIVNFVKSNASNAHCFSAMCHEMGASHEQVLLYSDVRWLSHGNVLHRLFEFRDEVQGLLKESPLVEHLCDEQFLAHLAYLAEVFDKLNLLNLSFQAVSTTILDLSDKIDAFTKKVDVWLREIQSGSVDHFSLLGDFLNGKNKELKLAVMKNVSAHLTALRTNFGEYFPDLDDCRYDWIRNPFSANVQLLSQFSHEVQENFLGLSSDRTLQLTFSPTNIPRFWLNVSNEYPQVSNEALKIIIPFASTCLCEAGFSAMVALKSKHSNNLDVQNNLILCLTSLEPNIQRLCDRKQGLTYF